MIGRTEVTDRLGPVLRRIQKLPPLERSRASQELLSQLADMQAAAAACRRSAVRELRSTMTLQAIAEVLGKSVSRIKQLQEGRQ